MKKNKIREDREMIIDKMNTLENLTNQEKAVRSEERRVGKEC